MHKNSDYRKKHLYAILAVLVVIVILLSVAYAALSTVLNVTFGNMTQTVQTWEVGFEVNDSITATKGGNGTSGRNCGTASTTVTTATINNTQISKPGDSCRWTLKIKNTGSIGAKLITITQNVPDDNSCQSDTNAKMTCGNVTYKLTTDSAGSNLLAVNELLNPSTYKYVYLFAEYTGTDIHVDDIVQSNASFSLVFSQN